MLQVTNAVASPLERIAASGWNNARDANQKIDLDFLTRWLSKKVDLPWKRIDPLQIDVTAVTAVTSHAYASRFNIICVEVHPDYVVFGTAEPYFTEWQNELQRVLNKEIRLVICNPLDIKRYLQELYSVSKSVLGAKKDQSSQSSAVQNLEQLMELGRHGKLEANDSHVVSLVDWLLQYAYEQRASDIHLEPRRETGVVRFRIDGVMQQVYDMPAGVMAAVTSRLKILGRLDVAEKRRPQDGRLKTRNNDAKEVELRMSTMHNIDLDFASGVRTLLRQDPDIIMVGEIRDLETAQMAVQAALTGHLVLSTLHTNDAASAVTRLLELGVPYYLIRSTLIGVVAQRLVRTFCPSCVARADGDEARWNELMAPWKSPAPSHINQAVGCLECRNSGFMGRAGIYELLQMTPNVKEMITPEVHLEQLRKQAYKDGMRPMRVSGLSKVASGMTSYEEILKVTPAPLLG